MSNNSIAASAGMSIAGNAADVGSKYVYDALMSSGSGSLAQGMKSMVNYMGGDFKFDPSVSYMGIGVVYGGVPAAGSTALASTGGQATIDAINAAQAAQAAADSAAAAAQAAQAAAQAAQASYEAAQAAAAASGSAADAAAAAQAAEAASTAADSAASASVAAADASVTAAETGASAAGATSGELTIFFSPMLFYLAIAMLIYQELTSCDSDEQTLALKKGEKLCHQVGTYCSSNTAVGCMVEKETYCCFNSRLARIINEQGRPQLGMSWGTAQDPQCGGFTIADFQKLDFSKIDLSEFIAEITPASVDSSSVAAKAKSSVSTLSGASSSSSTSTTTSSYYAQ